MRFVNFPYDFDENHNFIRDVLQIVAAQNNRVANVLETSNFLFSGCYTQSHRLIKSFNWFKAQFSSREMTRWLELQYGFGKIPRNYEKSMWITFENRRPPQKEFQRTLSFDVDSFSGANLYLPLWLLYIDFLENQSSWVRHKVTQKTLLLGRREMPTKKKFACAFINNPNPMRLRTIRELSNIGEIDVFGRYSDSYVDDKIEKSRAYL